MYPTHYCKNDKRMGVQLGVVVHDSNPSTWEVKAGGP
jgi:hypothetical protein